MASPNIQASQAALVFVTAGRSASIRVSQIAIVSLCYELPYNKIAVPFSLGGGIWGQPLWVQS